MAMPRAASILADLATLHRIRWDRRRCLVCGIAPWGGYVCAECQRECPSLTSLAGEWIEAQARRERTKTTDNVPARPAER